jgi:dTDP-4-amino-4,6-dideoxygalactose transaminase
MSGSMANEILLLDLDAQRRRLGKRIDDRIQTVLSHGRFIMGPEVTELESVLAERARVEHAVACSSGTDALMLPLLAWGIGPGDAVFVPTFSFTATAEVVALLGATPVFCDVDPHTYNLDAHSLSRAVDAVIQGGDLRPRAVIPVDLFGQPAAYTAIRAVVEPLQMHVLADAAQSFGASSRGEPVGSLGDATATSFFPAKPLGCYGDGGCVFTDDGALADVLRSVRVHGSGANKYDTVRLGLNARLDTLQAAVLLAKLEIFDEELAARDAVARRYTDSLKDLAETPTVLSECTSAWAQYTIQLADRDQVAAQLRSRGVPSAVYYPRPLHLQPAFGGRGLTDVPLETAEGLADRVLSVPMHPYLSHADQEVVISSLQASLAGRSSQSRTSETT